ncbi:hypothetical protein GCM10022221_68570 [Actinocorallia aurea]
MSEPKLYRVTVDLARMKADGKTLPSGRNNYEHPIYTPLPQRAGLIRFHYGKYVDIREIPLSAVNALPWKPAPPPARPHR